MSLKTRLRALEKKQGTEQPLAAKAYIGLDLDTCWQDPPLEPFSLPQDPARGYVCIPEADYDENTE